MKLTIPLSIVSLSFLVYMPISSLQIIAMGEKGYAKFVNPFVGTSAPGHTFPGATVPFGMVQVSPDTRVEGWDACGGYHYSDSLILGFSHTHLSGTGIADYGDILVIPIVENIELFTGDSIPSSFTHRRRFRHEDETAYPGYYSVRFEETDILAELTATSRVGVHRYTFPEKDSGGIIIDLLHGLGPDKVIESEIEIVGDKELVGLRRSSGWAKDQHVYFVAQFSEPFLSCGIILDDVIHADERSSFGKNLKCYVRFAPQKKPLIVKVGISSVSIEGAKKNLVMEVPDWNFDDVREKAGRSWNAELGKIEVEGGTEKQMRTFYTALYHTMIAPNVYSDVDGRYRGMDGKIYTATGFDMYTVFSLWDTFRAEHPLLTLIDRRRTLDFVKSLLSKYRENGILPVWELASNETWTMIGYHSIPVIVDAYMKGIREFDIKTAYEAMKHSAMADHYGLKVYRENGFIPGDIESESVSKTLEYAYDDWCIAQMAQALGEVDDYKYFADRSQFYKNLYDPSTGFMRPKVNNTWVVPFDPSSVTFHYTEANPWQYTFFAPHDEDGLITLMGGREKFIVKLDSLFRENSILIGRNQADITGLIGQYAQGNEPSHHFAYLYDYAGAPWKTQETVRLIMDSLFTDQPDGICGNDDCGQMSAWYVFSAMGIYPTCPGQPIYCIGSPVFEKVVIHFENDKKFTILSKDNGKANKYIHSAHLNGVTYTKSFLTHDDITHGGMIEFEMSRAPNIKWGTSEKDALPALPMDKIIAVPFFRTAGKSFPDSTVVRLGCVIEDAKIFYTLDGNDPDTNSLAYSTPIWLRQSATIKAIAIREGEKSKIVSSEFIKRASIGKITLNSKYSQQYTGGGDDALIDGLRGGSDFRLGAWQGYEQSSLDAIIDLGSQKVIDRVALGCLQDYNSWIFFPTYVEFSFSNDGRNFSSMVTKNNPISPEESGALLREFEVSGSPRSARFIRVLANNIGVCPPWHKGAGGKAWLFVDEIIVRTK